MMRSSSKFRSINPKSLLRPRRSYAISSSTAPLHDPPHYSDLIAEFTAHCCRRDLPRAMNAMNHLEKHGLRADCDAYAELIKCCVAQNAVEQAKHIHHNHLRSTVGYQPRTFLLNMLLGMYVKFKLVNEAQALFDEMPDRNVISWSTMISAYTNAKNGHRAMEFVVLMLREEIKPNMFTFSSVLRACDGCGTIKQLHGNIVKYGFKSDLFVGSSLIDVYAKWGELENAVGVFNEMMTRDLVVWNSIIGAFAQNGNGNEALSLFKRMKRSGFLANMGILTSALRACTGLALLELGRQVHVHALKHHDKDLILENALLDMYCKCGTLDYANLVFARMDDRDVISWSTMISGLAQNGFSFEAVELFRRMEKSGPRPNYITLVGVLFACSHAGLVEDGWHFFRSMKKVYGIDPGKEHYGCMIDLLGRAGKVEEAFGLIQEMGGGKADAVIWRTLLSACRIHKKPDMAIHAAKQILELDHGDVGTYVLLSNIYSSSQRWGEAMKLRREMDELGLQKAPGCSWIEVNKNIHAFVFRDQSHPQIDEICGKLSQLILRLRELMGYVPETSFILQDLEGEQMEDTLQYHSEKLAITFGLMSLPNGSEIRVRKNIRICGDCHIFAKLVSKMENRVIVIRDHVRYHHFKNGVCSCGDYW